MVVLLLRIVLYLYGPQFKTVDSSTLMDIVMIFLQTDGQDSTSVGQELVPYACFPICYSQIFISCNTV